MTAELAVLIVARDDAQAIRSLVADSGVARSIMVCKDVDAALAHSAASACDVVVLGVGAGEDLEAIDRMREQSSGRAFVAVTGRDDDALCDTALARGAQDCLVLSGLRADLLGHVLRRGVARARRGAQVRSQEAELRALFDLSPHPMWVFDAATLKFLAVNQVAVRTYGYSEREFLSMSIVDIRPSAEAERLKAHVGAGLEPAASSGIWRHRRKDGGELEVEIIAQSIPLWGHEARLVQARDVTVERRAIRALEASERRFRDLFEHSTGFICIHDLDGTLLSINPAAVTALGGNVAKLLGMPLRDLAAPELRFLVDNYLQRIACNGEDAGFMRVRNEAGAELVWQYRNRVHVDADGLSYVIGHAQDITAIRAAEAAFQRSERRLRTIADTLPLKIAYLDVQQRFAFANEAYRREVGTDVIGLHVRDVFGDERYARRRLYLDRAMQGERVTFEDAEGEDDDYRCVEVTFIPESAAGEGSVIGLHVMVQDITATKREEQRLIRLARVDSLTGLLNRTGFYERLENALARSRDQDSLLAILYLDIDRFKQINDTHGHAVGDALIRAFAERMSEKARLSDVVARLGGDEFTIVTEGFPDPGHVHTMAANLVAAMQRPFDLRGEGPTLSVSTSIGIAMGRAVPLAATHFVTRADAMLYEAKQAGRGTYRLTIIESADIGRDERPD